MQFSLGIILWELQNDTTIRTNISPEQDYPVERYEIWESGFPEKGTCYILDRERFLRDPALWRRRTILCSGWLEDEVIQNSEAYLVCVSGQLSMQELCRVVQKAMLHYYQWLVEVRALLCRKMPLGTVLDLLEQHYRIYACISTKAMQILGASAHYHEVCPWLSRENTVALTVVNDLSSDPDFQDASVVHGSFWYYSLQQDWYSCYNFLTQDSYDARMICCTEDHQKHFGLMALVSGLGDCIQDVYEDYLYDSFRAVMQKELQDCIRRQLQGSLLTEGEMHKILSVFRWEGQQEFQVILFRFLPGAGGQVGISYYPSQIQKLFRDCHVITLESQFVCIRNVTGEEDPFSVYQEKLPYYLRETLSKAGISGVFQDFHHLYHYYLEAENALLLGDRLDPTRWYYYFPNYSLPYILEQSTRELLPEQLFHPAVRDLLAYDEKNNTHLAESLRVFLENKQNVTHTADLLHIHRTSLLARLERMQNITPLDLEDPSCVLHLLLSFAMMDREKT